jgi:hypothetical protein
MTRWPGRSWRRTTRELYIKKRVQRRIWYWPFHYSQSVYISYNHEFDEEWDHKRDCIQSRTCTNAVQTQMRRDRLEYNERKYNFKKEWEIS